MSTHMKVSIAVALGSLATGIALLIWRKMSR
jgi:hypothetical protein